MPLVIRVDLFVLLFAFVVKSALWKKFVRGGTLDQPSGVTPDVHIFTRSKLSWIALPNSVPAFEVYYDVKALWPAASLERLAAIVAPAESDA